MRRTGLNKPSPSAEVTFCVNTSIPALLYKYSRITDANWTERMESSSERVIIIQFN